MEFRNKSRRSVNREAQLIRNISKKEREENSHKSCKTGRKTRKGGRERNGKKRMDTVAANGADEARSKGVANAERKGSRSRRWYSTGAARERTDEWVAGS